jgi:glycosyltransferase involved in cell wall biosynthesis
MLFSVIIPTYNRLELLKETLASVRSQRFSDYEVIVVDDGSTDGTAEALAEERTWLRYLAQPNRGPGAARNLGAQVARGDYLAFLDSDDLWLPWTLEVFATLIARHGRPALISGRYIDFKHSEAVTDLSESSSNGDAYPDYLASSRNGYFAGAGMWAIERNSFLAAGGFSTELWCGEDHDLALRLGTVPSFVQVKAPVTIAHRRHLSSAMADERLVLAALQSLLVSEREGRYPGGTSRAADRRRILSLHARPVALQRLMMRDFASAWRIYWETLRWHLADLRLKFVVGFPILALGRLIANRLR